MCCKYPATICCTLAGYFLCVLRPTVYRFFPLSYPAGSGSTYCCLFVGPCEMIFSPPKRDSFKREGFLEAGPPEKTCKCHINAECFDWLWEWVSTWAFLSACAFSKINNGSVIFSLARVWQLQGTVPVTVYIQNIWCVVLWRWQPKLYGSVSVERRSKPCLPRIQLTI